jgi:hypothetical protein
MSKGNKKCVTHNLEQCSIISPSDVVWQRVRIHSQLSSQLFVIGFRLNTRTPVMIEIKLSHDKNKISTKNYELKINDPVMDEIAFCGDFVVFLDTKRENILVNRLGHTTVSSFSLQVLNSFCYSLILFLSITSFSFLICFLWVNFSEKTFHISSSAHLHLKDLSSRNSFSLLNKNSSSEILFKLQTDTSPHNSLLSILYLGQQVREICTNSSESFITILFFVSFLKEGRKLNENE